MKEGDLVHQIAYNVVKEITNYERPTKKKKK